MVFLSGRCLRFISPFGRFNEELKEKSSLSLYLLPLTSLSLYASLSASLSLCLSLSSIFLSLSSSLFLSLSPSLSLSLLSLSFSLAYLMDVFILFCCCQTCGQNCRKKLLNTYFQDWCHDDYYNIFSKWSYFLPAGQQ